LWLGGGGTSLGHHCGGGQACVIKVTRGGVGASFMAKFCDVWMTLYLLVLSYLAEGKVVRYYNSG